MTKDSVSTAAAALGRQGGKSTSPAKRRASASNGKRGGRPSLREQAERRVDNSPALRPHKAVIMADWPEGQEHWRWVLRAKIVEIVDWATAGT